MRDEKYIIDLCDKVLGYEARRQRRFDFLKGDKAEKIKENGKSVIKNVMKEAGVRLPVDAYYEELNLVIEYHERQHFQPVGFFDNRMTCSGVPRGEQREIYDNRRRKRLAENDICLIELSYTDFNYRNSGKLMRDKNDISIIRDKLSKFLNKQNY